MTRASLLLLTVCLLYLLSLSSSSSSPLRRGRHARQARTPSAAPPPIGPFPWFNYTLGLDARVAALVSALTPREKLSLMSNKQPAIQRLGLPYYDFESEGSHGVARAGRATVFPSPIMLASTFSTELSYRAGRVVSMEGRGKFNAYVAQHGGNNTRWYSLHFLAPNSRRHTTHRDLLHALLRSKPVSCAPVCRVRCCASVNLFLHPKWGRGQETYGEDPYLTAEMGTWYVLGIQNWDPSNASLSYVEAGACAKHFYGYEDSVYNNEVNVTATDTLQTFQPAFKSLVQRGRVRSLMCAYR